MGPGLRVERGQSAHPPDAGRFRLLGPSIRRPGKRSPYPFMKRTNVRVEVSETMGHLCRLKYVLTVAAIIAATAPCRGEDEMFLRSEPPTPGEREWGVQYSVPWSSLPPRVPWDPEHETFPADLWTLLKRARNQTESGKGVTNEMELFEFEVHRMVIPRAWHLEPRHLSRSDFTNQWYLRAVYQGVWPRHYEVTQLMLLDGTLASTKTRRPRPSRAAEAPPLAAGTSAPSAASSEPPVDSLMDLWPLDEPWQQRPGPQWSPVLGAFPMDLGAATLKAKASLISELGISTDCVLVSVRAGHFMPLPAKPGGVRSDVGPPTIHWAVTFSFERPDTSPGVRRREYSATLLLDARIVRLSNTQVDIRPQSTTVSSTDPGVAAPQQEGREAATRCEALLHRPLDFIAITRFARQTLSTLEGAAVPANVIADFFLYPDDDWYFSALLLEPTGRQRAWRVDFNRSGEILRTLANNRKGPVSDGSE